MNDINRLLQIMARLRDPETGCPWDIKQTFATIAPYTIEEAYEVVDAIQQNDMAELRQELGDLLLQVVFHSRMAEEAGEFNFNDVAASICDKLERRHPHIFGEGRKNMSADEVRLNWEQQKQAEKKAAGKGAESVLDGIPSALPALMKSIKLQEKAASVGFEWPDYKGALAKLDEETTELKSAIRQGKPEQITDEIGDALFALCNLARYYKISPELALSGTIAKFTERFRFIENTLKSSNEDINNKTLEELDNLWKLAKKGS